MSLVISVGIVSLAVHLRFGSLEVLLLTDVMGNVATFLLGELSWVLHFFRLVINRILVLDVIIWRPYKSAILIFFPTIIGKNILIHQEINSSGKLINGHIFMSTRLFITYFRI